MDGIIVEQMLFGYNNGHSLINSSLKKSLMRQRDVDFLSDASGMGKFSSYITCYPIIEDGYYVFAKTWYADEMQRPGCVWTHVILISFDDLKRVGGKIDVTALFHRPDKSIGFGQYGESVFCPVLSTKPIEYDEYAIYTLLYSERKVLIEDENSEKYENSIIKVLAILPTYILKKVTICTCAISNRYLNNEVFDYQITLPGKMNILSREIDDTIIYKNIDVPFKVPLWVRYLQEKFVSGKQSQLFDFCEKYEKYRRIDLRDLSKIFYSVNEFTSKIVLQEYYNLLEKLDDSQELIEKTILLLFVEENEDMWTWFEETSLIEGLLDEMQNKKGILSKKDITDRKVEKYAKKIYAEYHKDYLQKIFWGYIHNELNYNGEKIVREIIKLLIPNDLYTIFNLDYSICMVLVQIDARFLLCKYIWKQDKNFQLELLCAADIKKDKNRIEILKSILECTNQNISDEVYQVFGEDLSNTLSVFYKSRKAFTSEQIHIWIPYCAKQKSVYIDLVRNVSDFEIVYELMHYIDSYQIEDMNECRLWIDTILKYWNLINLDRYYRISIFILPLLIKLNGTGEKFLNEIVFSQINNKLEKSAMDFYDWKNVSKVLPEVSVEQSWDKCLRLRLAFKDILR